MNELKHIYAIDYINNNQQFYDYTGYMLDKDYNDEQPFINCMSKDYVIVNNNCMHEIFRKENLPCLQDIDIPKGASINLFPGYPYAIDDIKKNYTVKRGVDTADYNIVSIKDRELYNNKYTQHRYDSIFIPAEKKVYFLQTERWSDKNIDIFTHFKRSLYNFNGAVNKYNLEDVVILHNDYYMVYDNEYLLSLLRGNFAKPCVWHDHLDLNTGNEVTIDLLNILYNVLIQNGYLKESEKNAIIQLNVLNQHDWREYKGTITMLFSTITGNSVLYRMSCHPSRYSKPVQEILSLYNRYRDVDVKFCNEKDFNLAQRYIDSKMQIGDGRVCTYYGMDKKLSEMSLKRNYFNALFGNIVKVIPKKYEENES